MIQSSSLSRPRLYDQSFTPAKKLMLPAKPAVHSNLNRTSFFPISKYGKITGKLVHSNHFFKVQRKRFRLDQPSPLGEIEPDLNGFLNQKQSASTAGRVKPQLNGFEGGFANKYPKGGEYSKSSKRPKGKPDLNYFFPSLCDRIPWSLERKSNRALPIPFREGGWGVRSIPRTFELDLFTKTRWSTGSKMPGVLPGSVGGQVPFVFDSFRVCTAVTLRFSGRVASSHHCPLRRHESPKQVRRPPAAVTHPTSEPQASIAFSSIAKRILWTLRVANFRARCHQDAIAHFDDMSHRSMRYESPKQASSHIPCSLPPVVDGSESHRRPDKINALAELWVLHHSIAYPKGVDPTNRRSIR